eukprot:15481606-Alexandrium_andersonii.AAC.1
MPIEDLLLRATETSIDAARKQSGNPYNAREGPHNPPTRLNNSADGRANCDELRQHVRMAEPPDKQPSKPPIESP